jgi:ABC-type phosphate transport system permease subunit
MSIPYAAMCVGAVLMAVMLAFARVGGETPPVDSLMNVE